MASRHETLDDYLHKYSDKKPLPTQVICYTLIFLLDLNLMQHRRSYLCSNVLLSGFSHGVGFCGLMRKGYTLGVLNEQIPLSVDHLHHPTGALREVE